MNPEQEKNAEMKARMEQWASGRKLVLHAGAVLLVILSLYFFMKTVNEIRTGQTIGTTSPAVNTISVSGEGEVFAVPDIATFSFSVTKDAKVASDAEKAATDQMNKAIAYIKSQGIADKDVKTTDYSLNPKYEYSNGICTQYACPPSKQTLTGYEVSQTVEVKVRDTSKAGDILAGVGALNVQSISGLSLTIDDQKSVDDQARTMAIADAKAQAQKLAGDLGVKLVRITSYTESGNYPGPIYYAKAMSMDSASAGTAPAAPAIPTGQNKITSNVTITYEIR